MVRRILVLILFFSLFGTLLGRSTQVFIDSQDRARAYTRHLEFNYIAWTIDAIHTKTLQAGLSPLRYMDDRATVYIVQNCLELTEGMQQSNNEIEKIYTDPSILNPAESSRDYQERLAFLENRWQLLGPVCESILQAQLSDVLASAGLSLGGTPVPPVLFHITPIPYALITSPREVIRQEANLSLDTDLSLSEMISLETQVELGLPNTSALVVPVGGIGVYPTMVKSTSSLPWLVEVVAHEWTHNFLTLRPLGLSYDVSAELRTINETAASIAGKELGTAVLRRFYPEYLPEAPQPTSETLPPTDTSVIDSMPFDFRVEMHITRVNADKLLLEGQIEEAEKYMEMRRQEFWDNGYPIRKLNQAYFAFHGAYADVPGGAAGEDPVGPLVRQLRDESDSLAKFLNRISWVSSLDALSRLVN
jgi:hypothetical protein